MSSHERERKPVVDVKSIQHESGSIERKIGGIMRKLISAKSEPRETAAAASPLNYVLNEWQIICEEGKGANKCSAAKDWHRKRAARINREK